MRLVQAALWLLLATGVLLLVGLGFGLASAVGWSLIGLNERTGLPVADWVLVWVGLGVLAQGMLRAVRRRKSKMNSNSEKVQA